MHVQRRQPKSSDKKSARNIRFNQRMNDLSPAPSRPAPSYPNPLAGSKATRPAWNESLEQREEVFACE